MWVGKYSPVVPGAVVRVGEHSPVVPGAIVGVG